MTEIELINKFKDLDSEELKRIGNNPNASFEEIIVASMIVTDREIENGECYTMEEVFGERKVSNRTN